MSARVEEIRQENRSGDVSYGDIEWLCRQADLLEDVLLALAMIEAGPADPLLRRQSQWAAGVAMGALSSVRERQGQA